MISNRELKSEIDQLTAQNKAMSDVIEQLKQMLNSQANQANQQQNQQQGQAGNNQDQNSNQGNNQSNQGQNNGSNGQNNQNGQNRQNNANNQQGQQNNQQQGSQIANIAYDFLQLKSLTNSLETKMNNFMSSQTGGNQLKQEDVAYLILNVMNGMIDWTIEYVSRSQGGQSN